MTPTHQRAHNVAQIAAGLSKAQRRALVEMPIAEFFTPDVYVRVIGTWACLKARRLIRPLDGDDWGHMATHIITPLGLAVRDHLAALEPKP